MIPKTPAEMPEMDAPAPKPKPDGQSGAGNDDLATGEGGPVELPADAHDLSKDD
jgi:hypothetical protein